MFGDVLDDDDFEGGWKTFVMVAIIMISGFIICAAGMCCCFFCCLRARKNQAIYSTPVVVTGQTFQPAHGSGPYPVSVQVTSGPDHQNRFQDQQNVPPIFQLRHPPTPVPSQNSTASSSLSSYQTEIESSTTNIRSELDSQVYPPTYEQAIGLETVQQPTAFSPSHKSEKAT